MSDFKCECVPCVVCGSPSWTCDFTECGDPDHADGVAVAPEGWACSEACWEKAAEEAARPAHVIEKIRHGGDRHGERVFYAVGPVRGSLAEAHDDEAKMVETTVSRREEELEGQLAGLREAEVIRAVGDYLETHRRDGSKSGPAWSRMAKAYDALRAGKGGGRSVRAASRRYEAAIHPERIGGGRPREGTP